jgi:hypothetical protein
MVAHGSEVPEGKPKSGRTWKTKQSSRASAKTRQGVLSHMRKSYEEKQAIRAQKKFVKDLEKQMIDEKAAKIEDEKQKRIEREQRRVANEYKSSSFQTVRAITNKIIISRIITPIIM